ncbi:DUF1206 domain-containing protein [Aeromicrobium sp.]|uniref:DUF1206 domain-containing protein n=1 Tax=Aeromicrobium sp. TaxID=1871063 RepID=UPI0019C5D6D7|nr:DUF1206 domain-containing protein [Aeromicrobium sp.]MBC7630102.1 DUF1206 domain-containing protein [Aeromicrobium sp.]
MSEGMARRGERAGREAHQSTTLETGARIGLVAYGIVHLLIAYIAVQVAWSGGGDASSGGALKTLDEQPFGKMLLWITTIGLVALVLWQLGSAVWGYRTEEEGLKRTRKRLSSAGRAALYAVLAVSAFKVVTGSSSGGGGSDSKEEGFTANLLGAPFGRVLVAIVGIAIVVVAVRQAHRGLTDSFTHDLQPQATSGRSGRAVLLVGRAGYVAKGVAIGIVGLLFGVSAITYDADKAGGLDDALKTLRDQPFGPILLSLVAAGLAAFGVFCFAWARYIRQR